MTLAARARSDPASAVLALLFLVALVIVTRAWLKLAPALPLWLDESFTAVISGQADAAGLLRHIRRDASAPLYYSAMWLLPGDSNAALRLPSLGFVIAAAALPLIWPVPRLAMATRIAWSALILLWNEAAMFAIDARPYALLLLIASAQTIAFARLLEAPSRKRAFAWTGLAGLAILTHYHAGALGLAQGLVLLGWHRRAALPLWPAVAMLIPAAAVLAWHAPQLAIYSAPGVAWYREYAPAAAMLLTLTIIGPKWKLLWLAAVGSRLASPRASGSGIAWATALAGVASLLLLEIGGTLRPMLTERYLAPGVPGLLLAMLLIAGNRPGQVLLTALFAWTALKGVTDRASDRTSVGLERASHALLGAGPPPRRLVYSLGYAGQRVLDPATMAEIGAYDFARHGAKVAATLVPTSSPRALEAAASRDAAIVWIYYDAQRAEADALKRRRRCFDLPRSNGGTLACPALGPR